MLNRFKSMKGDSLLKGAGRSRREGDLLPEAYHPHPVFFPKDSVSEKAGFWNSPRGTCSMAAAFGCHHHGKSPQLLLKVCTEIPAGYLRTPPSSKSTWGAFLGYGTMCPGIHTDQLCGFWHSLHLICKDDSVHTLLCHFDQRIKPYVQRLWCSSWHGAFNTWSIPSLHSCLCKIFLHQPPPTSTLPPTNAGVQTNVYCAGSLSCSVTLKTLGIFVLEIDKWC